MCMDVRDHHSSLGERRPRAAHDNESADTQTAPRVDLLHISDDPLATPGD